MGCASSLQAAPTEPSASTDLGDQGGEQPADSWPSADGPRAISPPGGHTSGRGAPDASLRSQKWQALVAWTEWHERDMFGWEQPRLAAVVGPHGRTSLSGVERPYDYQVAISFPGADFDKGSEGTCASLTDHTGRVLATSGTEFAEAVQKWIVDGCLDGSEQRGLDHVFVCSKNLRHTPGSVNATNFRHYSTRDAGDSDSTAVLNENWAMYLRESFLEARVVIFVINEDWLDSIPCNQEFEAVLTRKALLQPVDTKNAIILLDITNDRYNKRWGAKLPQLKAGLAHEAGKYFDVYNFTYNAQSTSQQKLAVQTDIISAVAKYMSKLVPPGGTEYHDLMSIAQTVYWPNWMYFGSLSGTNGWDHLVEVHDQAVEDGYDRQEPLWLPVSQPVQARRFRVRVMGVTGDTFNEGYKFMCRPLQFVDEASGTNIVAAGKGYWRSSAERMGCLGFSHWCGPKQYSWIEWVIPDDQPAVSVSKVDVRANARHWVFEAMPVSVCPSVGDDIRLYTFLGFEDATASTNVNKATKPPKWVQLHEHAASTAADENLVLYGAPPCSKFRLRVLDAVGTTPSNKVAFDLQIQCSLPAALYPIGGGHITGSGGDASMEDAPPANAFDGNDQTRWVDINGGGIGNTSWLGYEHTEAVKVMEYTITTQMYALSSYHSHLSGAPRDWELRARTAGGWVLVDKRALVYFAGHREERRFVAQSPVVATEYRFEFSAVAAGCASRSIQVGDIELRAELPHRCTPLEAHQVTVLSSAYNTVPDAAARASAAGRLAPDFGISWSPATVSELRARIPMHPDVASSSSLPRGQPDVVGVVRGGRLGWVLGEGRVSGWYDHPVEICMDPQLTGDPDAPATTRAMLASRPPKEPLTDVDHMHTVSFRRSYPDGEMQLVYEHDRPIVVEGYGFRSGNNYSRGDPQSWTLEAEAQSGDWVALHSVTNFQFPDRSAQVLLYLPDNSIAAARYRLVITEANAMLGLLHLQDVLLYTTFPRGDVVPDDVVPLQHRELAHVTLKLKPREAHGGVVRASGYRVAGAGGAGGAAPTSWILEGFTSEW